MLTIEKGRSALTDSELAEHLNMFFLSVNEGILHLGLTIGSSLATSQSPKLLIIMLPLAYNKISVLSKPGQQVIT